MVMGVRLCAMWYTRKALGAPHQETMTKHSYGLTPLLRNTVACAQGWACKCCRTKLPANFDVDHVVPRWKKGGHELDNLQALCHKCHGEKNHREMLERLHGIGTEKKKKTTKTRRPILLMKRPTLLRHAYNTRSRSHVLLG
jgi:hypothetical protein